VHPTPGGDAQGPRSSTRTVVLRRARSWDQSSSSPSRNVGPEMAGSGGRHARTQENRCRPSASRRAGLCCIRATEDAAWRRSGAVISGHTLGDGPLAPAARPTREPGLRGPRAKAESKGREQRSREQDRGLQSRARLSFLARIHSRGCPFAGGAVAPILPMPLFVWAAVRAWRASFASTPASR
jgi:hypothetical protein